MQIGMNIEAVSWSTSAWFSADAWFHVNNNGYPHLVTTLAQDYASGSEVMVLTDPSIFWNVGMPVFSGLNYSNNYSMMMSTSNQTVPLTLRNTLGSPICKVVQWGSATYDVFYPSGTQIFYTASNVLVDQGYGINGEALLPELVVSGRYTGYSQGLQQSQWVNPQQSWGAIYPYPTGNYKVFAKGTGSIQYSWYGPTGIFTDIVAISGGTPNHDIVITSGNVISHMQLQSSVTGDPLYDIRISMPDYNGTGLAANFQANQSNPYYFQFHPAFLDTCRPWSTLRYMDAQLTNQNPLQRWEDRPTYKGTTFGINNNAVPYEYLAQLANTLKKNSWWNIPTAADDNFIYQFATLLHNNINSPQKVYVELGNEVWNGVFVANGYMNHMGAAGSGSPFSVSGLTYNAGVATAVMNYQHQFRNNDLIQIENSNDDAYNGAFNINLVDGYTFTYHPTGIPSMNPAYPKLNHAIFALNTSSVYSWVISGISWTNNQQFTVTTSSTHNIPTYQYVQIANINDKDFNGIYSATALNPYQIQFDWTTDGYCRSLPKMNGAPGASVNVVPKSGQIMRLWWVADNSSHSTLPSSAGLGYTWFAQRNAFVRKTFQQVWGADSNRLIFVCAWQAPGPSVWFSQYVNYCGGSGFIKNDVSETVASCAPYFYQNNVSAGTFVSGYHQISSISCTGNVATVNINGGVGNYTSGSTVGIYNASPAGYCGLYTIQTISGSFITYNVLTPNMQAATAADNNVNGVMFSAQSNYCREATNVSATGNVATITSVGHGMSAGQWIFTCNAPVLGYMPFNALNGLYQITNVIDANTFTYSFPSNPPYILPTTPRLWYYPSGALDVLMNDVGQLPLTYLSGAAAYYNQWGATYRAYESGQSITNGAPGINIPTVFDLYAQANRCPQMGVVYTNYYNMLSGYGFAEANHFTNITPNSTFGDWGALEYQTQPATPRYQAMVSLAAGSSPSPTPTPTPTPTPIPTPQTSIRVGIYRGGSVFAAGVLSDNMLFNNNSILNYPYLGIHDGRSENKSIVNYDGVTKSISSGNFGIMIKDRYTILSFGNSTSTSNGKSYNKDNGWINTRQINKNGGWFYDDGMPINATPSRDYIGNETQSSYAYPGRLTYGYGAIGIAVTGYGAKMD